MIETNEDSVFMRKWAREMECKLQNHRVRNGSKYEHYVKCSRCIFYGTDVCKKKEEETKK